MDNIEDDARYPPKLRSVHRAQKYTSYPPHAVTSAIYGYNYGDDGLEEDDDEEEEEESDEIEVDVDSYNPRVYTQNFEQYDEFGRYPKRQRVKSAVSDYEFVPRTARMVPSGDESLVPEWSENEKYLLLEVWGDRFSQLGRKSLRSDDWVEVAEKVSEISGINRTESQCRQMMDAMKRKYKKEKAKGVNGSGKWPYFRKMDMILNQEFGGGGRPTLGCGVDSGEFVFTDTRVYLERANGNDEMRDSPCESEVEQDEEEREVTGLNDGGKGLRILADSVLKFGEIYEKIEMSKKKQMLELERLRLEFQRELELQKKQILERAQVEIAKIRESEDDDEEEEEDADNDVETRENINQ